MAHQVECTVTLVGKLLREQCLKFPQQENLYKTNRIGILRQARKLNSYWDGTTHLEMELHRNWFEFSELGSICLFHFLCSPCLLGTHWHTAVFFDWSHQRPRDTSLVFHHSCLHLDVWKKFCLKMLILSSITHRNLQNSILDVTVTNIECSSLILDNFYTFLSNALNFCIIFY